MSLQAPMTDEDLRHQEARRKQWTTEYTVGLVDPMGLVTETVCGPEDTDGMNSLARGLTPLEYHDGENRLRAWAREKGWTILKDRCIEDGCPEKYEAWKEIVKARDEGLKITFERSDIYPPSVLAQQARQGKADVKPLRWVAGKGLVAEDELEEAETVTKSRVKRLAGQLGIEEEKSRA